MSDELAGIHDRLVAIESALGVGAVRRRRFRFSLQALFWLLALAAVISFTTVEHWKAGSLKSENAKLKAENATLQAKTSANAEYAGRNGSLRRNSAGAHATA